jgi:cold shock CspA family protein
MAGIFISYRRLDSRVYSGRLFDRLKAHFGSDVVFMDVEGGIARGDDFSAAVERALNSVDAMVVVIGREWVSCTDRTGQPRLWNADDWVRQEIAAALRRDILLVPVLVDGASMPREDELPDGIQPFARRQAAEISDNRWDYDVGEIIKTLERAVSRCGREEGRKHSQAASPWVRSLRWVGWGFAGLTAVVGSIVWGDTYFAPNSSDYKGTVDPPQIRLERQQSDAAIQEVTLTVTNAGKRPARFLFETRVNPQPSPGVLAINPNTCDGVAVAVGAACTAKVVFNPKWLVDGEQKIDFSGAVDVSAASSGIVVSSQSLPLTIRQSPPPAPEVEAPVSLSGRVKWFEDAKGYGFITPDDGRQDVYVHYSAIQMPGFKTLKPGQKVRFVLRPDAAKREAANVTLDAAGVR